MIWLAPLVSMYLLLGFLVAGLVLPPVPAVLALAGVGARALMMLQMAMALAYTAAHRGTAVRRSSLVIYGALALTAIARLLSAMQSDIAGISAMNEGRYVFLIAWTASVHALWHGIPSRQRVRLLATVISFACGALGKLYLTLGVGFDARSKFVLYEKGFVANAIAYGLVLLLALFLFEARERGPLRWWHWLLTGVTLLLIAITGVRSVFAMVLTGALVLLARRWRPRSRRARIARGTVAAFGALAVVVLVSLSAISSESGGLGDDANLDRFATGRLSIWSAALHGVAQSPILGHGGYSGDIVAGNSLDDASSSMATLGSSGTLLLSGGLHNAYINGLYEYGFLGLGLSLLVLYLLYRRSKHMVTGGGAILMATWLGIAVRQAVEIQGLLGRSNGTGDYLTFLMVAVTFGSTLAPPHLRQPLDPFLDEIERQAPEPAIGAV